MLAGERAAWLRLVLTPGLGAGAARTLLDRFGLPTALFCDTVDHAALVDAVGTEGALALTRPPDEPLATALQRTQDWLDGGPRRSLVTLADTDYPRPLLQLPDAPALLYAEGDRALLARPALAIVGSRNATRQGEQNAAAFAAGIGRAGWCVVSGLAAGIDAAAHRGALESGSGTIALMGTGADIIYPAGNRPLAAAIAREGLLLSEYPIGTAPLARNFPRRNRLIAALARGVLVVEAALRSGSLITARLAADMGREVFAIPGSIHSPLARGCHRLIRDGAALVESTQDVFEQLGWARSLPAALPPRAAQTASPEPGAPDPGATAAPLLAALGHDPADIDTLALRTGMDPGKVAAGLLELELARRVERLAGNRYQRLHGPA
jgi:DNA processing protein